jgi:hypothetical protein
VVVCSSRAEQPDGVNTGCVGYSEGDGLPGGGFFVSMFHIFQTAWMERYLQAHLHSIQCPPNETMSAALKRQAPRVAVWTSALSEDEGGMGWSCKQALALQWLMFAGAVIRYVAAARVRRRGETDAYVTQSSIVGVGIHIFVLTIRIRVRHMMRDGTMKDEEEKLVGGSERVTYGSLAGRKQ